MKIEEIRQLATWLGEAGLSVLELKRDDDSLLLRRASQPLSVAASALSAAASRKAPLQITASGPGLFYATHPDEGVAYVQTGEVIAVGQLVAVLRVGTLLLPIRSAVAGRVVETLVADAQVVGYGQALFELEALAA